MIVTSPSHLSAITNIVGRSTNWVVKAWVVDNQTNNLASGLSLFDGSTFIGTGTNCTITNLAAGNHYIWASALDANGDTVYSPTNLLTSYVDYGPLASCIPITNTLIQGSSVTLKANVTSSNSTWSAAVAITNVSFYTNNVFAGQSLSSSSPYSFTIKASKLGTNTFFAIAKDALGMSKQSPSERFVVVPPLPPSISLLSPTNGTTLTKIGDLDLPVTVVAQANNTHDSITNVSVYDGSLLVGRSTNCTITNITVGTHSIWAKCTDNYNLTAYSSTNLVVIKNPPTPPKITWKSPVPPALVMRGESVFLSVTNEDSFHYLANVSYFTNGTLFSNAVNAGQNYAVLFTPSQHGTNAILATATDLDGLTCTITNHVVLGDVPTILITEPLSGTEFTNCSVNPIDINMSVFLLNSNEWTSATWALSDGTNVLCTNMPLFVTNYTLSNPTNQAYSLIGSITDSLGHVTSTTNTVIVVHQDYGPQVSLLKPAGTNEALELKPYLLKATADVTWATITNVTFYTNDVPVTCSNVPSMGSFYSNGVYNMPVTFHQVGKYAVKVEALDSLGMLKTASGVLQVVEAAKPSENTVKNITVGGGQACPGMAVYSFHAMKASLHVQDTPIIYQPPYGPAVVFTVAYNSREYGQPVIIPHSNLGHLWSMSCVSYIEDNPTNATDSIRCFVPGGGSELYYGCGQYDPTSGAYLERVENLGYLRHLPDGTILEYGLSNGSTNAPRRIYMTKETDRLGLSLTYGYDPAFRLVSITDAAGG
ncbi:MAG TPA: RHS repeat domain-containing protein, partial [Clostridia bacterium]|nr:RHS repeat domain-containing protein [Clostridia bacterium]